ncbi:MAG: transglutaminase family protein [Chloroflexi bacterium]|nr:MAG: transglutaminase family protein [Chloroflexota bacterium]TMC69833.1 MAG: transglutaminase family protein [Chloroflexota bacterium]
MSGKSINLRVGCEFAYDVSAPTPVTVQVRPRSDARHRLITEAWATTPQLPVDEYHDFYGNPVKRLVMPAGALVLKYDATCAVPDEPDPDGSGALQVPVEELPGEILHFTLPSRYCLSDQLMGTAWDLFSGTGPGGARVQAICDWVHDNIKFQYGTSNPLTTAMDVFTARIGVCRDFAHLAISFCRAMNIPARYVFGYLPDIYVPVPPEPMDFAAWMEVWLADRWWTFDPRNNQRRVGRVLIGRGRDALDVAMLTTFGPASFRSMTVWADLAKEAA